MMNESTLKVIGGYFELALPSETQHLYPEALRFQSARAAFNALLMTGKPNRVWMPKYICYSMLATLIAIEIEIVFYDLDLGFSVSNDVKLESDDWLLYVNYFGICSYEQDNLLKRFNPSQLVFDHAQAFFIPPRECLATIYSPRKFFGGPDGGFLVTLLSIVQPEQIDTDLGARCNHLLICVDSTPEAGYQYYKDAKNTLNMLMLPRRMSKLTDRLLGGTDYMGVKTKCNSNFSLLHRLLKYINRLIINELQIDGSLCYPVLLDDLIIRERLINKRIFVAKYWPEVKSRIEVVDFE